MRMKTPLLVWILGLAFVISTNVRLGAQTDARKEKILKSLQDYQDFSAMGASGSTFIDAATINSFKNLFELDANLFWDLFRKESQRINYLLTVDEYVDSVQRVFAGRKPVISYGKHSLEINSNGKTAVAYLRKTLNIPDSHDSGAYKMNKTILNLRLLFNILNDTVLIQNITEDTRLTRIRSLNVEGCYNFMSKISGSFLGNPVSAINPGIVAGYTFSDQSGYHVGVNIDVRLNRKTLDGLVVNLGLIYSKTDFTVNVDNYAGTYRQSFDPGENPFEVSVYDRSPSIGEKIALTGFSVPVTAKWFMTHRLYLQAGPQFSVLSGTSKAGYTLSHTGGGKIILLNESALPANEQTWFYLDEQHEMDDAQYGFFRNREFSFSSSANMTTLNVAAVFGIGFEARFKKIVISFEPWLNLGITALTGKSGNTEYKLYPQANYNSFLLTCESPRLNSFGLKLIIGKMFYR
jgi:hypothetical protein